MELSSIVLFGYMETLIVTMLFYDLWNNVYQLLVKYFIEYILLKHLNQNSS